MSSLIKNVIIVGAGGHLGPTILSAFASDSRFATSILTRKSSASTFPSNIKVFRVSDDYPEAELLEAFKGQDAIVSTIATASAGTQKLLIDAAIKSGVKRFVPSEFGSDTRNAKAMEILPQYFAGKAGAVDYLKSKEKDGLTWSAFVTGPFFELAVAGFMGFDQASKVATIFNDGNGKFSTTTFGSIGLAVKNAMLVPEKTANKYLYVDSWTLSQNQILASFEKATGKWDVVRVDAEEQKKAGLAKMASGDFSGAMSLIRYINTVEGQGGNYATYTESSNDLLSLPKLDLDEVIAGIVKG